jgi:hypothetical protein
MVVVIVDHVCGCGYAYAVSLLSLLMWVFGMNLYLSTQVLIKFDQLKLLIAGKPVSLSLILAFMSYNSQHLLSTNHKYTHACYNCCSEEKVMRSLLKMMLSSRPA